jgi:hypothetical protein
MATELSLVSLKSSPGGGAMMSGFPTTSAHARLEVLSWPGTEAKERQRPTHRGKVAQLNGEDLEILCGRARDERDTEEEGALTA